MCYIYLPNTGGSLLSFVFQTLRSTFLSMFSFRSSVLKRAGVVVVFVAGSVGFTVVGFKAFVLASVHFTVGFRGFEVALVDSNGFTVVRLGVGLNVVALRGLVLPSVGFRALVVASVGLTVLENLLTLVFLYLTRALPLPVADDVWV